MHGCEPDDLRAGGIRLPSYQQSAVFGAARFTWNNWSRQVGKSFTFTLRRLLRGLARRRDQLLLSAGERQSRELMLKVHGHCRALTIACELRGQTACAGTAFSRLEARLPNGVRILALPANPMTARGFTADVFLDEFAMHRDDQAIWAALFPTLLRGDGELDVASTPRGRANLFHRLRDNAHFATSTVTLRDAIAAGLDADEAAVRAAMGDERLFRQEFLCEFDDEPDAFLSHELITSCVDPGLTTAVDAAALNDRRSELYAGIDVGRKRDLTVIWIWRRRGSEFETAGVVELERAPFAAQRLAAEQVLRGVGLRRACVDATGIGMPLAEELAAAFGADRVEGVTFTPGVQAAMAGRVRRFLEERRLRLPADEAIHRDWHAVRRVVSGAGRIAFRAERSAEGHADRFWAAALGLHAAGEAVDARIEYAAAPLTFGRGGVW